MVSAVKKGAEAEMIGGFLDYSQDSFLHRLNPLAKIFLSLMLCISCFVTDSLYFCLFMILRSGDGGLGGDIESHGYAGSSGQTKCLLT